MATLEALDLRSVRDPETGCLRWQGAHSPKGYGQIMLNGRLSSAHRASYERSFGPIPDGLEIDHVYDRGCRYRDCIEPSHLEAVTHRENVLRAARAGRYPYGPYDDSECRLGHPRTDENTVFTTSGKPMCATCRSSQSLESGRRMKPCPHCGMEMQSKNLSRHVKKFHQDDQIQETP